MSAENASATPDALLNPIEARIVGCLMEKQRTTPEQYPLTLNSLVSACNQKSARHPVMNLTPGEVGHAVNRLRDRGLIHASLSGRSERFDHKLVGTFFLSRQEQALLCALMLRGPQTLGELRTNTARLADFADLDQVSTILRGMATRDHALVLELPRSPGKREERYAHLLCGQPRTEDLADVEPRTGASAGVAAQDSRIEALESEVASLRAELDRLWELTGLADQRGDA
ncbi:YceH family protein [Thiocystis violascens]|uniref:Uncharacterized protein n=1 Tax=Thiocystis violascens (strain ATCC 17096 / DSM 198 / 6111) TaxID=765911 RepID=I3YH53_THIV6|nr:YceH family protein [Thiocystis violascens]AFL76321.1 hypothetical protein Thivi_4526 [Thiocystis violascens DSM 198]